MAGNTYFPLANVNAPGHRFDRTTAMAYSGRDLEDTFAVHAGNVDNATTKIEIITLFFNNYKSKHLCSTLKMNSVLYNNKP